MMDELIDIVNTDGKPTGKTCLKSNAHLHGILHASVHVWLYTSDGKILVQKRTKNKDTFPNLWDVSVAGHIGAGELPILAAIREVKEEINLTLSKKQLKYHGYCTEKHKHHNGILDHEIHHIFTGELQVNIALLKPQKEEVAALKLIDLHELEKNYNDDTYFVPHSTSYYKNIIKKLKEIKP